MTADAMMFDLHTAPMRIGAVRLRVRDPAAVSAFYRDVVGLRPVAAATDGSGIAVGAGGTALLVLEGDPSLAPRNAREAGLFHTAFLMPTRAHLARWLAFATELRVPLQGTSDHIVSEAIYLADPEGNGIEIYADRPVSRWRSPDGAIRMATEPLNREDLLAAAGGDAWAGFPDEGLVGHVHLQVGDIAEAERFYRDVLGFDVASRYPGAAFFGSGGYHHQLAANVWNSRGAETRSGETAGLGEIEIVVRDESAITAIVDRAARADIATQRDGSGAAALRDPWGTRLTLRPPRLERHVNGRFSPGSRLGG